MDLLPLVFSSGWASVVAAWLAVLVTGVADRRRREQHPAPAPTGGPRGW